MDGEISRDDLMKSLEMAKVATDKIHEVQMQALKKHFSSEEQHSSEEQQ
jgi:hypothetical protein